jgi:hypothetical protein
MNDRIKELYVQSGGLVRMYDGKLTYFPAYQKNVGNGNFEFSSFDPEKFAELIVKECNKIMAKQYQGPIPQDVRHMMLVLQEHFGVEE